MEFVNVIVDISHEKLDRIFQYHVPEELKDRLQIGMKVNVPFGKGNRLMKGYVVGFADEVDYPPDRIKELSGIVEGSVKAESQLIAMAGWMRDTYGSTLNQALKTVLPVKRQVVQKQSRKLTLQIPREEAETLLEEYLRKNYRAKARLMAALLDLDKEGLDYKKASEGLKIAPSVIKRFQEEGLVQIKSETVYRNPFAGRFTKKEERFSYHNEYAYPLNTTGKPEAVKRILKWAMGHGITGLGRFGEWEHLNTDVTVERAMNLIRTFRK